MKRNVDIEIQKAQEFEKRELIKIELPIASQEISEAPTAVAENENSAIA
jgi:hypothetical protein